jgi:tRNA(fMet)-specific endonuclease VapC
LILLDTNALSAFIDGEPEIGTRLVSESFVAIPVIVLGEFRYGISGSRYRGKYERWLEDHVPEFEILAVTEPTTLVYARLRVALKKTGRPIPANDAWIAALALQHRLPILSRDEHFDAVPGLRREIW